MINVVDSSSLSLLHIQKCDNRLFSNEYLDTQIVRDDAATIAVSESP